MAQKKFAVRVGLIPLLVAPKCFQVIVSGSLNESEDHLGRIGAI
jgi:hypothetical protein